MESAKKVFLKANPEIVCREEESDALLFNPENGAIRMLNHVGYEVWKLCDGSLTFDEIVKKIKGKYPAAPARAVEKDVADFIKNMEKMALIAGKV